MKTRFFIPRDKWKRQKLQQKLYHIAGSPTLEAFKAMLKSNIIKNCPVTAADGGIAEKFMDQKFQP